MLASKIIDCQKKIIYKQLQRSHGRKSKLRIEIWEYLGRLTSDIDISPGLFFRLFTSTKGKFACLDEKNEPKACIQLGLEKRKLFNFLLLIQLFLIPEVNKNVIKVIPHETTNCLTLKQLDFKYFRGTPSCFFDWKCDSSIKINLESKKSTKRYFKFINIL